VMACRLSREYNARESVLACREGIKEFLQMRRE